MREEALKVQAVCLLFVFFLESEGSTRATNGHLIFITVILPDPDEKSSHYHYHLFETWDCPASLCSILHLHLLYYQRRILHYFEALYLELTFSKVGFIKHLHSLKGVEGFVTISLAWCNSCQVWCATLLLLSDRWWQIAVHHRKCPVTYTQ